MCIYIYICIHCFRVHVAQINVDFSTQFSKYTLRQGTTVSSNKC